jgi:hypothetical protein
MLHFLYSTDHVISSVVFVYRAVVLVLSLIGFSDTASTSKTFWEEVLIPVFLQLQRGWQEL